jgi:putative glycosyltransferase
MERLKVGIATTVFNGELTIRPFVESISKLSAKCENFATFTLTVVDDGSFDTSWIKIQECIQLYPDLDIKVHQHSRNFGHHAALLNAMSLVPPSSDLVFLIDSDGEEDPMTFLQMYPLIVQDDVFAVIGYQKNRKGGRFEKISGYFAWKLIKSFSNFNGERNIVTTRVLKPVVVTEISKISLSNPVLGLIHSDLGFKTEYLPILKTSKGSTTYSLKKRVKLFLKFFVYDHHALARLGVFFGFLGMLFSIISGVYFVAYRIFSPFPLPGYASMGLLVSFLVGLLMLIQALTILVISQIYRQIIHIKPVILPPREFSDESE